METPGFALIFAARQFMASCVRELEETGQTWQCLITLSVVRAVPGLHQQGIAERTGLDRTTLGPLLADLEYEGLVTRQIDPVDRRMLRITATEDASEALREMNAAVQRAEDALTRPLSPRQRKSLKGLLKALVPERPTVAAAILADW